MNSRPDVVSIGVCVLAGGLSSRMGVEKASLKLGRSSLLTIIRRTARELGLPVRLIRRDRVPRCGPLGGIYTGLITSRAEAELFLACDMPFVDAALLEKFLARYRSTRRPLFARCAKVAGFPLIVRCDAAGAVREQIENKGYSLQKLASGLKADFLEIEATESTKLININTRRDWETAAEIWSRNSSTR